ncbi:GAF domain-containing protein [Brevibacillus sp. SYP-B805]|uniref:GAF domain-containing protein n=1 Tax=Brevibacillus sp. SYP-B805 TaxID=1578199 RepID=UPI0013EDE053|nr:GAF domain-containing protein [Brevibacillus sp. SYP-B805]NGQ93927.1 GAF domain-containing protein [Brevibacillus sp. SYP-B805]
MTNEEIVTFLERARVETRSDYAALAYANENGEVKWLQAVGNRSNRYKRMTTSMRQGIFGRVIKLDRPLVMNHLSIRTYQEIQDYAIILTEQLKSFIAIPHYQEERAGLFLIGRRTDDIYTDEILNKAIDLAKTFLS